jgi:hypothetical protein
MVAEKKDEVQGRALDFEGMTQVDLEGEMRHGCGLACDWPAMLGNVAVIRRRSTLTQFGHRPELH